MENVKNKKFSIIVVSFNTKKKFLETINSIITQTYNDYEIIVVDGVSVDGTKDEIIKMKDYFSHFIIEQDDGIYDAMNKGIIKATGNWVIFMNSGDSFYNKDVLQNFHLSNNEKYDVIFGDTVIKNNLFQHLHKSKNFDSKTVLMPFCHQSVFVKLQKLREKNFNTNYKYSSDFDFFFENFVNQSKFLKINRIISVVRSAGSSDLNRQKVFSENLEILQKKKLNKSYLILYYYKLLEFFKNIFKILLTKKNVLHFLKYKYRNNIID